MEVLHAPFHPKSHPASRPDRRRPPAGRRSTFRPGIGCAASGAIHPGGLCRSGRLPRFGHDHLAQEGWPFHGSAFLHRLGSQRRAGPSLQGRRQVRGVRRSCPVQGGRLLGHCAGEREDGPGAPCRQFPGDRGDPLRCNFEGGEAGIGWRAPGRAFQVKDRGHGKPLALSTKTRALEEGP